MPRRNRTGSWLATSAPASSTCPAVGSTSRLTIRSVVDLPQPEGPTRTSSSPRRTSRSRSCTATVPSGYSLRTPRKLMTASAAASMAPTVPAVMAHRARPSATVTEMSAGQPPNPWLSWAYVEHNWGDITTALSQHTTLTIQAVLIAIALAFPLAVLARARPRLAGLVLGLSGVLYTIPSLALFAILAPFTGIGRTTVLIGLVAYAMLVLVRNILVGLQGVDPEIRDAARGLGYGRTRMLLTVELPNALPSIIVGVHALQPHQDVADQD